MENAHVLNYCQIITALHVGLSLVVANLYIVKLNNKTI